MNRLAITRVSMHEKLNKKHLAYIMLDEKRDFVDFQVFEEGESLLNNIYVGRVENIVPNIKGAFIRISPKQICYLPLEDVKSPLYTNKPSKRNELCIGDELVVQVVKDALKTKDPVVSTKITMTSKYAVLTTDNTSLGVSKKITGDNHLKLNDFIHTFKEVSDMHGFGVIIRTNALEATIEDLKEDIQELICRFITLKESSLHQCAYYLLEQPDEPYVQKLKSVDLSLLDAIYTDDKEIYDKIEEKLPYLMEKGLLRLYTDDKVSLGTVYNFRGSLDKLVEKRVWLKSGANIIIEQLETMTVIDINSGKNTSKNEDSILAINKEAAIEIARQLKLRNISGMIIIDFINMKSKEHMSELIQTLKDQIKKDPIPCSFMDVTRLGLVELTRKKTYKSLKEIIQKT